MASGVYVKTENGLAPAATARGPQGPKGDPGTPGSQGPQGVQGNPGDVGAAFISTGVTGAQTISGSPLGTTQNWTLGGNITVGLTATPPSTVAGTATLVIKQAASGGPYTVTWPTLEWASDAPAPSMPSTANAEMIVHLFWTGTAWRAIYGGSFFP